MYHNNNAFSKSKHQYKTSSYINTRLPIMQMYIVYRQSFITFFFFLIQFYVPFKLFHSNRDESIGGWGENRSTRGKTT